MAGPEDQQQQLREQPQVDPAVVAPAAIPGATGVQKLQYLAQTGRGSPPELATVAFLINQNPTNRDAMVAYSQQTWGNEYTQGVIAIAAQPAPLAANDATDPSALGAPGATGKGVAPPKIEAKAPAGKASTGWVDGEEKQVDDAHQRPPVGPDGVPPPPQFIYDAQGAARKDQIVNPAGQNYRATNTPVQPVPGQIVLPPDAAATTPGGERSVAQSDTTSDAKLGTMATTVDTSKTIDPNKAPMQLDGYKKQADAALDGQIAALAQKKPVFGGQVASVGSAADPTSTVESLKQAKIKLAEARTEVEVDTIVQQHGLLITPHANQTYGKQVTTQQGLNAGGLADGSAIYANNKKTAEMVQTDANGSTVTQTTDQTREVGTKGVNFSNTTSTTKVDADGKTTQTTAKDSLSGGFTEPLRLNASATTAKDGKVKNLNGGGQIGEGFGGGTLGASRIDEKTGAGVSASGKAGMVNDANGTGAKLSLDDARADIGGKQVSGGFYGSADGQIQMSVTPTADGGVTLTLTASGRAKLGVFGGKRDSTEPVTVGTDWNASGGANLQGAEAVTRTRTLSAEEAKKVLGDLDALSTGPAGGKRVFGAAAQEKAYSAVFHGKLTDLWSNDGQAHAAGESASKLTETGFGVDGKAGASTGADATSRTGAGGSFNVSKVDINGEKESKTDKETTHAVVVGGRTSFGVDGNVSEGVAGGTAGYNQSNQATKSYVFSVPNDKPELLAQVRALKTAKQATDFAALHPEIYKGVVEGNVDSEGKKVGATVGPVGVTGGTQSTETGDVAKGQQVVLGPDGKPVRGADGKPIVKKTLSGTEDGERKDDASATLLGVKLAQGNTTVKSHGAVDTDGQSSLDVTQSDSEEQISRDVAKKNAAAMKNMGKGDVAVTAATGGAMAFVKKLAERVGEPSTFGAHLDNAAFQQLCGVAASDQKRWNDAILVDFRGEWFALRNELNHPNPPAGWIAQDESGPDHLAATQLARMKAIAHFVAVAGPAGQQAIAHARGEYGPNAIGETVSWPSSLADQKPVYADLTNKVEHLRATLLAFAKAGDSPGGKQLLADLGVKLGALRQRVQDAPDHADPTLGVRAANGIGNMQQTVTAWGAKFDNALEAQKAGAPVETALDGAQLAKSTALDQKEKGDDQKAVADAKAATTKLEQAGPTTTYGAARSTDKQWTDFDKQHGAAMAAEQKATDQQQADHDAQTAARAAESKSKAEAAIPDFEQRCVAAKGKAFGLVDAAVAAAPVHFYSSADTTDQDLMSLGTLMREWLQNWNQLAEYYKDAGRPGSRTDLVPGLSMAKLDQIYKNTNISEHLKTYCGTLRSSWGRDF